MKNRIYMLTILLAGLFALAACSDENVMTAPATPGAMPAQTYSLVEVDEPGRDISYPITIGSRLDSEAGYIFVRNDADYLYLDYYMFGDRRLLDSYIHIGRAQSDIPVDEAGRPIKDEFRYNFVLSRGMASYTHMIPLSELGLSVGQSIVIASYASIVEGEQSQPEISKAVMSSNWWFTKDFTIRRPWIGGDRIVSRDEAYTQGRLED
jgi:hypothetical protein